MNARILLLLGGLAASLAISVTRSPPPDPAAEEIEWRTNLKEAEEEARASGKPMLVVFRCEP